MVDDQVTPLFLNQINTSSLAILSHTIRTLADRPGPRAPPVVRDFDRPITFVRTFPCQKV